MLSVILALVSLLPQAAPAQGLSDANIIAIFDAANTYDIETGTLGEQKGSSKEVRAVGASLVRDHQAVRQQGRDLAENVGGAPMAPAVNPLAEQHAKALVDLKAKSGSAFDRAFLDREIA